MKRTNDDIEEPVRKSWLLLVVGILILVFMLGLGVFLLVEALQTPKGPEDALDMKRMLTSGVGVLLFSMVIIIFLYSLYKPTGKKKKGRPVPKKPVRKTVKKK
jgi:hypothetical protein